MKRTEKYFLTIHDELFSDLIVPSKLEKLNHRKANASFIEDNSLFTTHELILLIILFDFKLKYPDNSISLSYIHQRYRNKRIGKTYVMSKADLDAYKIALNGLQTKMIMLKTNNTRYRFHQDHKEINNQSIFDITEINSKSNGDLIFKYSFKEYGEIISKSRRYSNMLPIDILRIPYKQIMKLYIALYISRLIFINRKKKKLEFTITIDSIMKNIRIHNVKGEDVGINLYQLVNSQDIRKYSKSKLFNIYLNEVLEMIKLKEEIHDYRLSTENGQKCQIIIKK